MDLGQKLREAIARLTGKAYVDEAAVKALIRDLQRVLIASDVNVKLVLQLSKRIEERSLQAKKLEALSLKEHVLKVVYDELAHFLGSSYSPRLDKHKVLVCGLFGSGKSTSVAKLAHFYKSRGLSVGMVGADIDRPAAQDQLEQLARQLSVPFYTIRGEKDASKIVADALSRNKEDVLIVDSAGRSALDDELAGELQRIREALAPDETYLVLSADIGQVAGKQSEQFNRIAPLSGVIITKMDGSGKGGGALSSVAASDANIAFIGMGEKIGDLELYDSTKFVGRLLGVPDFAGLLEKVEKIAREEQLQPMSGDQLTIESFYQQLKAAKKLGPLGGVFGMMGMVDVPGEMVHQSESKLKKFEAMIQSMTPTERKDAALLKARSRISRIARGSGCGENEVREFLNMFEKMEKMMGMFKRNRGFRSKIEKMMKGGGMANLKLG